MLLTAKKLYKNSIMELVPEEKLVVITAEKPILSPSNENVEETLFLVDFDVDS